MKKLSEFRGEEALDVLADIIEPAAEIMQDKAMVTLFRSGDRAKAVSVALKNHKWSVLSIMARLDEEDIETYAPSVFALPIKLLEIFNDPELVSLFTSQGQTEAPTNSGSASASTEASAE
jgi:hypothetical protein